MTDQYDELLTRLRALQADTEKMEAQFGATLAHLKTRMEAARSAIEDGDRSGAVRILTGEVEALRQTKLAGGGASIQ